MFTLAVTHAVNQWHYCLMLESSHDKLIYFCFLTTYMQLITVLYLLLYTVPCITPHILSGNILSNGFTPYFSFLARI